VQNKLDTPLVSLGKRDLKNVAVPLEVYRVVLPWEKGVLAGAATVTGNRRIKRLRLAALVGVPAVLLVAFFLWWFASPYFVNRVPKASPTTATPNEPPSIAVLPFDNVSNDPNNEYFSDGMTDELIDALSKLPGLKVIARTSVFTYKGKPQDVRQIGQQLNVRTILQGSAEKVGDKVRIRVQLVSAMDGSQLWSESYDRQMQDVFAVQDEISQAIVKTLQIKFLGQAVKPSTENTEAHELYLQGDYFLSKAEKKEEFEKAFEYFNKALAKDPNYALAYAGLAATYLKQNAWGYLPDEEALPKAKEAALKALELDDTLDAAHLSSGAVRAIVDNDLQGAEAEYKRAIELNPNNAEAHNAYARLLAQTGRTKEALAEEKRAVELDPVAMGLRLFLGKIFEKLGSYAQAVEQYQKAIELEPNDSLPYLWLGWLKQQQGDLKEALELFQKMSEINPSFADIHDYMGDIKAMLLDWKGAEEELKRVIELQPQEPQSYDYYISYLLGRKRTAEALKETQLALDLLPDSRVMSISAGLFYYVARQYDRAIELYQTTIKFQDPNWTGLAYIYLAHVYWQKGMYAEGVESDLQGWMLPHNSVFFEPEEQFEQAFKASVEEFRQTFKTSGLEGYLQKVNEFISTRAKGKCWGSYGEVAAQRYALVGGVDQALECLRKLYSGNTDSNNDDPIGAALVIQSPDFDGIRSDPKFIALLKRWGLEK
jgi:serine/threonine-protein kinase